VLNFTASQKECVEDRKSLQATQAQLSVSKGLSTLLASAKAAGASNPFLSAQERDALPGSAELKAVSGFAKNFLPLLFNLARSVDEDHSREAVLDTVEQFASVSDGPLLNQLFQRVLQKFLEASSAGAEEEKVSARLADVLCALCRGGPSPPNCVLAFQACAPPIQQARLVQLQKKGYKLLGCLVREAALLSSDSPLNFELVTTLLAEARAAVVPQVPTANPSPASCAFC
jgi:hypothetical protein